MLLALSLAGFVAIALDVTQHGLLERHDMRVGLWVYDHTPDSVVRVANAITQLGGAWSIVGLTAIGVVVLLRHGRRGDALLLVCSVGLGALATRVLKLAFDRLRPTIGEPRALPHTASFPSGHTSGAMVVFVLLAVLLAMRWRRPAVVIAVLLAVLVGVTRVVVEAHWLTDVLAGYCLGGAIVAAALLVRLRLAGRASRPGGNGDGQHRGEQERQLGGPAGAEDRLGQPSRMDDVAEPGRDVHVGR